MRTNHSVAIKRMRDKADELRHAGLVLHLRPEQQALILRVAADLLECHDDTGINLYAWPNPLKFVEAWSGLPVRDNGS